MDLSAPLLRFITNHYDTSSAEYREAVGELNSLREATVVRTPDKHEAGLDLISRYECIAVIITLSIPSAITINSYPYKLECQYQKRRCVHCCSGRYCSYGLLQVSIKFSWYDAFSKEGFLSSGRKICKYCILLYLYAIMYC